LPFLTHFTSMLRVSVPPASIIPSKETFCDSIPSSQLVITSHVFAGDHALNDDSSSSSSATMVLQSSKSPHGSSSKLPSAQLEETVKLTLKDHAAEMHNFLSKSSEIRIKSSPALLDSTILPIKNQITFRKVYMVVGLLALLRVFNLGFLPSNAFSDSFPYLPLDYATTHTTSVAVDISNAPFIHHLLHSSIFSLQTWVRSPEFHDFVLLFEISSLSPRFLSLLRA
jgi:hypothetical protein